MPRQAGALDKGMVISKVRFIEAVSAELIEYFNGVECARVSRGEAETIALSAFQRVLDAVHSTSSEIN